MQRAFSDDVQNAEADQDSHCPRLERWRCSSGGGAIDNCPVQITHCVRPKIQRSTVLRNQMPVFSDDALGSKAPRYVKGDEKIFEDASRLAVENGY